MYIKNFLSILVDNLFLIILIVLFIIVGLFIISETVMWEERLYLAEDNKDAEEFIEKIENDNKLYFQKKIIIEGTDGKVLLYYKEKVK